MPTYVYKCPSCAKQFEQQRAIADRDLTFWCRACEAECVRIPCVTAQKFPGSDAWRTRIKSHGEGM